MKKLFLSLGLSVTVLLSAVYARPEKKSTASRVPSTVELAQFQKQYPGLAKRLGLSAVPQRMQGFLSGYGLMPEPTLRLVSAVKSNREDKALVKIVVGDAWGDGSGYQILLDSKAKICDDINLYKGVIDPSLYDKADFSIPADAAPEVGKTSVLDERQDSIYLDGGIYDVIVVNPAEDEEDLKLWIAAGSAVWNDFTFAEGYTYTYSLSVDWINQKEYCLLDLPLALSAETINLPEVGCAVESEVDVKLVVKNNGAADLSGYTIWYRVQGGSETVTETIPDVLKSGQEKELTFSRKLSIGDADSVYTVYAGVQAFYGDVDHSDDTVQGRIVKKAAVNVPYTFDIAKYDLSGKPEAWIIGETAEATMEPGVPLISRCLNLEKDKTYRVSFDLHAGMLLFDFLPLPETYRIGFGPTSQPLSKWEIVFEEEELLMEDWLSMDFEVTPTETGTYALYFQAEDFGILGVRNVRISEVADYDARMEEFLTGMPRLIPAEHVNGNFTATVSVRNRGKLKIDETEVAIKLKDAVVGSAKIKGLAPNAVKSATISMSVSGLKINDTAEFIASAKVQNEQEEQESDNSMKQSVWVSDVDMVYDYVTEEMYGSDRYAIGIDGGSIGCGIPFRLNVKDTLTAVSLGWAEIEADMNIGIRIHKWNPATQALGDLFYETKVSRGTAAGQHEYKVPALLMEAGDYMISAIQLTSFFNLVTDGRKGGTLYITTNNPISINTELGTPSIRAVFGHDGKPMKKDVFVSEITKPDEKGIFAVNQVVTATVVNQGYERIDNVPIALTVNGETVGKKTIDLAAYEQTEVVFVADLSTPGIEYELKVFSSLPDDEDFSNDTCTKKVTALQPANPYIMDWENCEDFAIEGFNPVWKAVDMDGAPTYGFENIYFPHSEEAFAFIAFAPDALEGADDHMQPHTGKRFGAAFCSAAGINNDWLISPKLKIVEGRAFMSFFVKTYNDAYGLENFNVLVSETDDNIESFIRLGETREAPFDDWSEVEVDLSGYAGKEIHLAIQCVSEDKFVFMVDDIYVCSRVSNENLAPVSSLLSVYPNPAHETITIHAMDIAIRQVEIFNPAGVLIQQFGNLNTSDFRYNIKHFASGIYFARVQTEQGSAVLKFMVR